MRAALSHVTGTQWSMLEHAEVGVSRMVRDYKDFCKVKHYVQLQSPFSFLDSKRLINPSSGVVACPDDGVNCNQANYVGCNIQANWNNMCYGDIKFSCKKQTRLRQCLT